MDLAGSERLSQAASEDVDREKLRQKEVRGGTGEGGSPSKSVDSEEHTSEGGGGRGPGEDKGSPEHIAAQLTC